MKIRCDKCTFYGPSKRSEDHGQCFRHPPALIPDGEGDAYTARPLTPKDGWCGEFQTRREIEDEDRREH